MDINLNYISRNIEIYNVGEIKKLKNNGKFLDAKTDRENRPRKYEDA